VVQLFSACHYVHTHRDLKLGNFFLDARMNVKVGDCGLAALMEKIPGRGRRPSVERQIILHLKSLFDTVNSHSFEV
jgi:cell cycle serine/threonine-protein kinase CDC5/MSD2